MLLLGCSTSTRNNVALRAEQAQALAVQLANDKADSVYHCRPFGLEQPARFAQGRWLWTDRSGHGYGDLEAVVTLAADGTTNSIDLKLLDSRVPVRY